MKHVVDAGVIPVKSSKHPDRTKALRMGMNDEPPSRIERVAKFLNRHKKYAKWRANHVARAEVNAARASNKNNPSWHGIGHS